MTVVLDALVAADAERCAELERALFPGESPWPAAAFEAELRAPHNHYFAAREDGALLGYAGLSALGGEDPESEVHTIGVDPEAQGRGIGRMLLDALLAVADAHGGPVFLDVRVDNAPAIGLYESTGFVKVGVRKRYYMPSGADANVMCREPVSDKNSAVEDPS